MFLATLILATLTASRAPTPPMDTPILPNAAYLVEARVVRVDEKAYEATLAIERVYTGDNALKGRTFTIPVDDQLWLESALHGHPIGEPLVKGELVLLWVYRDASSDEAKDKRRLFAAIGIDSSLPFIYFPCSAILSGAPVPSEVVISHAYSDVEGDPYDFGPKVMLEWADAIQKVYGASGDDRRIALLKKYASSANPPLSAWGIHTLSRFLEPEAKKQLFDEDELRNDSEWLLQHDLAKRVRKDVKSVLEDLADDPQLPVYAQLELDRVLTRMDEDDWLKSCRRSTMLERWKKIKNPFDRYFIREQLKNQAAAK